MRRSTPCRRCQRMERVRFGAAAGGAFGTAGLGRALDGGTSVGCAVGGVLWTANITTNTVAAATRDSDNAARRPSRAAHPYARQGVMSSVPSPCGQVPATTSVSMSPGGAPGAHQEGRRSDDWTAHRRARGLNGAPPPGAATRSRSCPDRACPERKAACQLFVCLWPGNCGPYANPQNEEISFEVVKQLLGPGSSDEGASQSRCCP